MPCVSGTYNPSVGILVPVAILPISFLGAFNPQATGPHTLFTSLIDTGASATCISRRVVNEVSLEPIGRQPVATAAGTILVPTYQFCLGLVIGQRQEANAQVRGDLHIARILGSEFANDGCEFDVLLGRDVICLGAFHMSFDGHFVICV